jgi:hypothetical protein
MDWSEGGSDIDGEILSVVKLKKYSFHTFHGLDIGRPQYRFLLAPPDIELSPLK